MRTSEIPHCSHHHIILACPHDDCPEQTAYLEEQRIRMQNYYALQEHEAHRLVQEEIERMQA